MTTGDSRVPATTPLVGRRTLLGAAVAAGALGAAVAAGPAHAGVLARHVLVAGARPRYRIAHGAGEGATVRHAAAELQELIAAMSGVTLPIVLVSAAEDPTIDPPEPRSIVLGRLNAWAENTAGPATTPLPAEDLDRDGFSYRTDGTDVLIAGRSPRGTLYGVYHLLDNILGVRWWAPGATQVPQRDTVAIDGALLNVDEDPRFNYREILTSDGIRQYAWRHHNRLNGQRGFETRDTGVAPPAGLDTWSRLWAGINPGQFTDIISDTSLWYGNQVLFMEPRVRQIATDDLVSRIQARMVVDPQDRSHPFHMRDAMYGPVDADSQAFIDQHGGVLSAAALDMVNDVAARVAQQIPGARLETQAYLWMSTPPQDMTVATNVELTTAAINADFGHSMFESPNDDVAQSTEAWRQRSQRMIMWDYLYTWNDFLVPFPDYRAHVRTIKQAAAHPQFDGYFGECQFGDGSTGLQFKAMKSWVYGRLLWDPSLDADALIDEWCQGYYGPGGVHVAAVLQRLEDALAASQYSLRTYRVTVGAGFLDWQTLRDCDLLMDQAELAAAGDTTLLTRIGVARMILDHPILLRRAELGHAAAAAGLPWELSYQPRMNRFAAAKAAAKLLYFNLSRDAFTWLLGSYAIERRVGALPSRCVGLPVERYRVVEETGLWQFPRYSSSVADSLSVTGASARMIGDKESWAVQLSMTDVPQEGRWRLFVSLRAEQTAAVVPDRDGFKIGVHRPNGLRQEQTWRNDQLPHVGFGELEFEVDLQFEADGNYIFLTGFTGNTGLSWLHVERLYLVRVDGS